jgi:hypothetical protein
MADTSAPEATAGGSTVVKVKPEAKLRIKSQIVANAVTYGFLEIPFNVNDITGQDSVDGRSPHCPTKKYGIDDTMVRWTHFRDRRIVTVASDRVCSN